MRCSTSQCSLARARNRVTPAISNVKPHAQMQRRSAVSVSNFAMCCQAVLRLLHMRAAESLRISSQVPPEASPPSALWCCVVWSLLASWCDRTGSDLLALAWCLSTTFGLGGDQSCSPFRLKARALPRKSVGVSSVCLCWQKYSRRKPRRKRTTVTGKTACSPMTTCVCSY